jgi:hypothetical protein
MIILGRLGETGLLGGHSLSMEYQISLMLPRTGDREQAQEKDKRGDKVLDREQAELLQKEDLLILKVRLLTQTIRFLIVPKM